VLLEVEYPHVVST